MFTDKRLPSFVILKDYKPNVAANSKCRLINQSMRELGKVSKLLIEKVSTITRDKSLVNEWRGTDTVIKWFKNIDNKSNCIFRQLGIKDYQQGRSKNHNGFSSIPFTE